VSEQESEPPHIDAVSGQAAWLLVQGIMLRLVKEGVISKETMKEDVNAAIAFSENSPGLNPAQRSASVLFRTLLDMLETADRSGHH
jgi:hypothetical protein